MSFFRQHWYYFGGVLFVILAFSIGFFGQDINRIRLILIFNYMAILVHQFEEYALPGGFPSISNSIVFGEKQAPDRYPLNKQIHFLINVVFAWPFFIAPIIFSNAIWLGLAAIYFGSVFEFIVHGIVYPMRIKKLYNPGLGAVVFLSTPLSIYYIWYVATNGLVSQIDYFLGVVACLVFVGILLILMLPTLGLMSRTSKYPFSKAEMERNKKYIINK